MTFEYHVYLCLVLSTRLAYLRQDNATGLRFAIVLAVVQTLLVVLAFGATGLAAATAAAALCFTIVGGWLERHLSPNWCRLGVLAALVLIPASLQPWLGVLEFTAPAKAFATSVGQIGETVIGYRGIEPDRFAAVLLALLLLANEVNIAMRGIFSALDLVPRQENASGHGGAAADVREYNAGRFIGILERWLMFLVVLFADDWGALGFIIAAKGLVRLDKLKDTIFAEYMLVGTLLSALFAIAVAWLVR